MSKIFIPGKLLAVTRTTKINGELVGSTAIVSELEVLRVWAGEAVLSDHSRWCIYCTRELYGNKRCDCSGKDFQRRMPAPSND